MHYLFERHDSLDDPIECFIFDASAEVFPVKPHWHYFAEFIFMLRGSAEMTCDGTSYIVREGELIVFSPSAVHSVFSADGMPPLYAVMKFDMLGLPRHSSYAPSLRDIFMYARSEGMKIHFDAGTAEAMKCRETFSECINEIKEYRYGVDVMLRSRIYMLTYGIVRQWIDDGLNIDNCPSAPEDTYGIENITEYIDSHLDENIKVSDIASKCHMSYSGFAAKFSERYGMSCKEYMEKMRIFKAEEYLLFTDHDLNFISQQTGFSDCSHFIHSFKKFRGITPKQKKKKKKQGTK